MTYPDNCARVYAVVTDECEDPGAVVDVATGGGDENPNPMPTPPKPLDYIPPAEVFPGHHAAQGEGGETPADQV